MPRERAVTLRDIADRLGLSPQTVSMGLNGTGRMTDATRRRVRQTAEAMGYVPNVAARSLVMRRGYCIGVVLPYFSGSFFADIISGIESVAHAHDYALLLGNSSGGAETLQRFRRRKVDGLIVYPGRRETTPVAELLQSRIPLVQIMNTLPELGAASVTVDNFGGGETAAGHLASLGHRRIGMLTHDGASPELARRHDGFLAALRRLAPDATPHLRECPPEVAGGEAAAAALLTEFPETTALFAASDYAALGAIRAALKLGRRIPEDLSIVGFDDLELAGSQMVYPLTTLAQPKAEIGHRAAAMLLALLQKRIVTAEQLPAPLVIRATTGPAPSPHVTGRPPDAAAAQLPPKGVNP